VLSNYEFLLDSDAASTAGSAGGRRNREEERMQVWSAAARTWSLG
jgi:hypothetical protein